MGNTISKFCKTLSHPIREYERRKTMKIYKEVVLQSDPEEGVGFIKDKVDDKLFKQMEVN